MREWDRVVSTAIARSRFWPKPSDLTGYRAELCPQGALTPQRQRQTDPWREEREKRAKFEDMRKALSPKEFEDFQRRAETDLNDLSRGAAARLKDSTRQLMIINIAVDMADGSYERQIV